MDTLLIIFLLVGVAIVILLLLKKKESGGSEKLTTMMERLNVLSEQNRELRQSLDNKLSETHRTTQESLRSSADFTQRMHSQSIKQVADITEKLARLEETNKQVVNFSEQLKSLQDILKNPKQRGVLGEYYLKEILENVLPPNSFQLQYPFKDGNIVDAVVFVQKKIIPIDSKFSLENYERIISCNEKSERDRLEKAFKQDLKNRIDETSKYIKPGEGTMDFAFMFIPSEAIYYDLLVNKVGAVQVNTTDLIQYAIRDKKVIIVSPTSFHAYLQTVLQGLRALKIEESAKQIQADVEKLGRHIGSYEEFLGKLGNSLSTTVNHYNTAHKEFEKIDKDVVKITGGERISETLVLEKPKSEE